MRRCVRVPAIGESDVLRSVALLPGVVARNDFSAGFNVRGGEADQNLVLLDGIPIYNPFHLGGLFGTFIDKAVSGMDVLTGAFPARYGGRLSSVLDVKSLEETRRGAHGCGRISLLSSSLFGGGIARQGKLSWNVARASHVCRQGRGADSRAAMISRITFRTRSCRVDFFCLTAARSA